VLLRLLPGGAGPAALLAAAPGVTERAYACVSAHRSRLSRVIPSSVKRRATALIRRRTARA
jgi:hypothetical protein